MLEVYADEKEERYSIVIINGEKYVADISYSVDFLDNEKEADIKYDCILEVLNDHEVSVFIKGFWKYTSLKCIYQCQKKMIANFLEQTIGLFNGKQIINVDIDDCYNAMSQQGRFYSTEVSVPKCEDELKKWLMGIEKNNILDKNTILRIEGDVSMMDCDTICNLICEFVEGENNNIVVSASYVKEYEGNARISLWSAIE